MFQGQVVRLGKSVKWLEGARKGQDMEQAKEVFQVHQGGPLLRVIASVDCLALGTLAN